MLHGFQAGHHLAVPAGEVWNTEQRFLHDVHPQFSRAAPGIDFLEQRKRDSFFVHNEETCLIMK